MIKVLNSFCALEITDDEVSIDLNAVPYLYRYNFGNNLMFLQSDGEVNSRNNSFSVALLNRLLTTSPTFYPDTIEANYHENRAIPQLYAGALPIMQYKKCRLLFVQGFGYGATIKGNALRITYIDNTLKRHVDLCSIFDRNTNSNIEIIPKNVFFDGNTYTQAIEFNILDIDYLYNSTDITLIDIRENSFGTIKPTIFKVTHDTLTESNFDDNTNILNFVSTNKIITSYELATINEDIFVDIQNTGKYLEIVAKHVLNYDIDNILKTILQATSDNVLTIRYAITVVMYDNAYTEIGNYTHILENANNRYFPIRYIPILSDLTHYFSVVVTYTVFNRQNGFTVQKNGITTNLAALPYVIDTIPKLLVLNAPTVNFIKTQNIIQVKHTTDKPTVVYLNSFNN